MSGELGALPRTLTLASQDSGCRGTVVGTIVTPRLCSAGDLFRVLDFPFLSFYRFHGSCCASGVFGFLLTLSTVKLQSLMAPGQCAAWIFLAKVLTAGLSVLLFDVVLTGAASGCLLLGGLGEALLVFSEQKGS